MLSDLFRCLTSVILLGCCLRFSYLAACALSRSGTTSVRLCATVVVAMWSLVVLFSLLGAVRAFRVQFAVPLWIGLAALAEMRLGRTKEIRAVVRRDVARLAELPRLLVRSELAILLPLACALVGLRVWRGLVAPPLAWDALTYHLVRAGRWVQDGGVVRALAPDAWGYYEYFGQTGDVLWAWAMLPVRSDLLLAPTAGFIWLSCLISGYAIARVLGAREIQASSAALAIACTPAVINYASSAYVDSTLLATFMLSAVFLGRALHTRSPADGALACAALGLSAGVKFTGVFFLGAGGVVLLGTLVRGQVHSSRRLFLCACALGTLVAAPSFLRAWQETGSPFYPFPFRMLGRTLFPGNEELQLILSARLSAPAARALPPMRFLEFLLYARPDPGWQFVNLGPTAPLLLLLGVVGTVRLRSARVLWPLVAYLVVSAAVVVVSLLSDDLAAQRGQWAPVVGRMLLPAFAVTVILGAAAPEYLARPLFGVSIATGLLLAMPEGFRAPDWSGMVRVLPGLLAGAGLAGFTCWALRTRARWLRAGFALLGLALGLMMANRVRGGLRGEIYAAAATPGAPAFDGDRLYSEYASSWPIWGYFDEATPHRLAVTAGWDGTGHNWYVYPLFGSRLQNRVFYVPVTADGSIVDYREQEEVVSRASSSAWLERLVKEDVDHVVVLPPAPPLETQWIGEHPDLFIPIDHLAGPGRAYRFKRNLARSQMSGRG